MKDSQIFKLIFTKTGNLATQYKKIVDTFPVLCADKNYGGIDDVIWNRSDLVEADFTPLYSDTNLWSNTRHIEIISVNTGEVLAANGSRTPIIVMELRTHVFDTNLQKQLLLEFE